MYDEEEYPQEEEEEYQSAGADKPFDVVHKNIGETVTLVLKDGRKIDGILVGYDLELNLVLEKAQVIRGDDVRGVGVVIVRRNNILAIEDHVLL
ncbi:MAG TPA: small nuclear ribonucleoprotein [Methanofastidiosum sp.]|nr:small nuclear ribonucleoprotein [Methanofastidiosum sp.]HOC78389.1 small nuclear ribonucleoprotein [Methanofastidiosum sp.]HOG74559.1 small nuclear ribonucleoprotein [Methanofastidiosum sp.]HPA49838.1 small nuclear ribonucleoprotein [Methanofastidiosum sp.]HQK63172.1 small nuclear ribonucleoprotein [Methanofastidiosum sp.]